MEVDKERQIWLPGKIRSLTIEHKEFQQRETQKEKEREEVRENRD